MADGGAEIWVYGAGAVGSCLGGMLARGGHQVVLIGRDPHMTAVRERGLRIRGLWGDFLVREGLRALTSLPETGRPDLVLLTVKSYDTAAAAEDLAARLDPAVPVLSLQNGVGNVEILARRLGPGRVLAGMVIIGFEIPVPGEVRVTVQADDIRLGRPGKPPDEVVRNVVSWFRGSGIPAREDPHIESSQWGKVLYNSALNPLGAILRCHYGALLQDASWRVIRSVIHEAYAALAKARVAVPWPTAEAYLSHLRSVQIPATFDHRPSMLVDLERRGRTEIDVINGALVRLGESVEVSTPVNAALCDIIHALERLRRG